MTIKPKDRDAVIQSLRAGVVPRAGQHLVQVGRVRELESLIADIDRIASGGSAFRLVIGEYGSGKTFFLNLVRAVGMEKKLVTTRSPCVALRPIASMSTFWNDIGTILMPCAASRASVSPDRTSIFVPMARSPRSMKSGPF